MNETSFNFKQGFSIKYQDKTANIRVAIQDIDIKLLTSISL